MASRYGKVRVGTVWGRLVDRRTNKYGIAAPEQRLFGGRLYASRAERDFRQQLDLMEKAGEIVDIVEQPRVELESGIFYKPDFKATEIPSQQTVFFEVKGVVTQRFALICRLWRLHGPATLRIVKRGRRGQFVTTREIHPHG